jgi:hypothetical protein
MTKSSLRAAEGDTATVKGTVDPGATIEIDQSKIPSGVTVGTPNVNSATGFFSFTVQMPEIGHYELALTVTKDANPQRAPSWWNARRITPPIRQRCTKWIMTA